MHDTSGGRQGLMSTTRGCISLCHCSESTQESWPTDKSASDLSDGPANRLGHQRRAQPVGLDLSALPSLPRRPLPDPSCWSTSVGPLSHHPIGTALPTPWPHQCWQARRPSGASKISDIKF